MVYVSRFTLCLSWIPILYLWLQCQTELYTLCSISVSVWRFTLILYSHKSFTFFALHFAPAHCRAKRKHTVPSLLSLSLSLQPFLFLGSRCVLHISCFPLQCQTELHTLHPLCFCVYRGGVMFTLTISGFTFRASHFVFHIAVPNRPTLCILCLSLSLCGQVMIHNPYFMLPIAVPNRATRSASCAFSPAGRSRTTASSTWCTPCLTCPCSASPDAPRYVLTSTCKNSVNNVPR